MKNYQKPSLLTVNDLLLVNTQGTIPLSCSGNLPANCTGGFANLGVTSFCEILGDFASDFLVPGTNCTDPVITQCTMTVNGQPSASFCNGGLIVQFTGDCGSSGCAVELRCQNPDVACSGGETVEISCPGFESCTQTAIDTVP